MLPCFHDDSSTGPNHGSDNLCPSPHEATNAAYPRPTPTQQARVPAVSSSYDPAPRIMVTVQGVGRRRADPSSHHREQARLMPVMPKMNHTSLRIIVVVNGRMIGGELTAFVVGFLSTNTFLCASISLML